MRARFVIRERQSKRFGRRLVHLAVRPVLDRRAAPCTQTDIFLSSLLPFLPFLLLILFIKNTLHENRIIGANNIRTAGVPDFLVQWPRLRGLKRVDVAVGAERRCDVQIADALVK